MSINLFNISYLSFRLAPIIIVGFFLLQSFFELDFKGIIYLFGLLITTFLSVSLSYLSVFQQTSEHAMDSISENCRTIRLGDNGYISNIPLNLVVYSFTLFYLLIFVLNLANSKDNKGVLNEKAMNQTNINAVLWQGIPIMVLFPLLIVAEVLWIWSNDCLKGTQSMWINVMVAFLIGSVGGVIWALMITSLKIPQFQYFVSSSSYVCDRPRKALYRCKTLGKT